MNKLLTEIDGLDADDVEDFFESGEEEEVSSSGELESVHVVDSEVEDNAPVKDKVEDKEDKEPREHLKRSAVHERQQRQ